MEEIEYPKQRNIDGVYFRVERNGKWLNVCASDMTHDELAKAIENYDCDSLKRFVHILAEVLRDVCDQFNITGGY